MIELKFNQRPVEVPSDLRLYRRLSILCISLSECCRGNSASFKQLNFINALIMNQNFLSIYIDYKKNKIPLKNLCPPADPYHIRCVNYAMGVGLVNQKKIKYTFKVELSEYGRDFVDSIKKEELVTDVFDHCKGIGTISEKEINSILNA